MATFKKIVGITILGLVVLGLGVFLFLYNVPYSEGSRSGVVMKMSKKGVLLKTYEGTLNVEGIDTYNKKGSMSSVWYFSVDKGSDELIQQLEKASLKNKRVQLRYKELYTKFFWRGDTRYFITDIIYDMEEEQKRLPVQDSLPSPASNNP
ncbi:hypothetical protein [Algivirga pacifica]